MLILTSDGLSSDNLIQETKKYISTHRTAAIITTASVGYKEKDWHIPRVTDELQSLGLSVSYLDLEFESPELINDYDVVVINGGNPFYLLKHIKKWEMDSIFKEFAENYILIGISAGSIILQNTIDLFARFSPEMNDDVNLSDFTGLCLTNHEILPHYSRFVTRYDRFEERAMEYETERNIKLFRINDGQALYISCNQFYVF